MTHLEAHTVGFEMCQPAYRVCPTGVFTKELKMYGIFHIETDTLVASFATRELAEEAYKHFVTSKIEYAIGLI